MHDEAQKKVIHELRKMVLKGNDLRGSILIDKLSERTKLGNDHIRICLKILRDKGWLKAASWTATGQPVGLVEINIPPPPKPEWETRWESVLANYQNLTEPDREALKGCGSKFADMKADDHVRIIDGLIKLRHDQSSLKDQPTYLVSARYFMGSSKLINEIPNRALKDFGIDPGLFLGHPLYVVAGGATEPVATILIENPASFELALESSAAQHCAFIATFGFGLDKASDEYGKQLAGMIEDKFEYAVTLVREGFSCPPAKQLLASANLYFWGDLDMAGMHIFERIAAKISHVQLSALYVPMIKAIHDTERRHPYATATGSGKPNQKMFRTNRPDVQEMLTYCERYAVDQEIVLLEEIELLASQALDISVLGSITHQT